MYIKKSVLGTMVALAGGAVLTALCILFSFTEVAIPVPVYAAAWFSCLGGMLALTSRIFR
ncbi:hypothetical protein LKD70_12475 [Ruminococcus sp. CLA-AA-H200]|uniref:Uncharacterized protein n=1 Tax=Ruminococcus turbiniformis TaxID=2881258 RepID=A0ABS8G0V5_9FIRM|nr:hypothetical protein [Ruminococcus turbiniformis]MCC2255223.1 hypothetical protein [Ruminococcus turbiniformis]